MLKVAYAESFLEGQLQAAEELRAEGAELLESWSRAGEIQRAKWARAAGLGAATGELERAELTSFGATFELVEELVADRLVSGQVNTYFNPAGGASAAHGAGLEVLNDTDWAARRLTEAGLLVGCLDLDAHGLEEPSCFTVSIHEEGQLSNADVQLQLGAGAGDQGLLKQIAAGIRELRAAGQLEVLMLRVGADGLAGDPSSSLAFTHDGYIEAAVLISQFARELNSSVLVLGAGVGGTEEVQVWADMVHLLATGQVFG